MDLKSVVKQQRFVEKKSVLFWCQITIISLIFMIAPFSKGLFNGYKTSFDTAIMTFQCFFFGVSILFALFLLRRKPVDLQTESTHWIIWILPIIYFISALVSPASSYQALQAINIQIAYSFAFVMGLYFSRTIFTQKMLLSSILGSGALIIIFGFMNWFGDASLWGLIKWKLTGVPQTTYQDAVLISSDGARLTSVFQYGNSYAAYLIAMIVSFLVIAVHSKQAKHVFISSLLLVPAVISLLLTLSRGGLIVFPIIVLLTLPFMRWKRQLILIGYLAVSGIISLLILNPITNLGTVLQQQFDASDAFKGWGILILASLGTATIHAVIHYYVLAKKTDNEERTHWNRVPLNAVIPLGLVVLGGFLAALLFSTNLITNLLPEHIKNRIENINFAQNSVLERGTFYSDAWKLALDYPVFGAGGGSWASLYEKYQNNPYTSNQTHSYFMQILVETGFIGLIAILAILGFIYFSFIRSYRKIQSESRSYFLVYFVIATSILVHSILDFNMSYVYLSLIVYLCLGGMLAIDESKPFNWQKKLSLSKVNYIYPLLLLGCSIIFMFFVINNLNSNTLFTTTKTISYQGAPFNEVNQQIDNAIDKLKNPEYYELKLQFYFSAYNQSGNPQFIEQAEAILASIKLREPHFKPLVYRELELYLLKNDYAKAKEILESGIHNYHWDINFYVELADVHFKEGLAQLKVGQPENALQEWNLVNQVIQQVEEKAIYLNSLPENQVQGREFGLVPDFSLILGKIAYHKGFYAEAEQQLQKRLDASYDDPKDIDATTYYVASLRKQKKADQSYLHDMLEKLPENEQIRVNKQFQELLTQIP